MASPFQEACIERAIVRMAQYFPEEATILHAGGIPTVAIHSKNGWMTRVLGGILQSTVRGVEEMKKQTTDSDIWFAAIGIAEAVNEELGAWGKPCLGRKSIVLEEKAWMRGHGAPSRFQREVTIWWKNKNPVHDWQKEWQPVRGGHCFQEDAEGFIARLRVGQEHNEFKVGEVA